MRVSRGRKGEVIASARRKGSFCFQAHENRRALLACAHCLGYVGTPTQQLEHLRKSALESPLPSLSALEVKSHEIHRCKECSEVYCSAACLSQDMAMGHKLLCPGITDLMKSFRAYALASSESFLFAAKVITAIAIRHGLGDKTSLKDLVSRIWRSGKCWEVLAPEGGARAASLMQQAEETWGMLSTCLRLEHKLAEAEEDEGGRPIMCFEFYARLLGMAERELLPVQCDSPLVKYCQELMAADTKTKELAMRALSSYADEVTEVSSDPSLSRQVLFDRKVCRLAQAARDATGEAVFSPLVGVALLEWEPPGELVHSCIPNAQLDVSQGDGEGDGIVISLLALRDIQDEALSIAMVSVTQPWPARQLDMRGRLHQGDWTCGCIRCQVERSALAPMEWVKQQEGMSPGHLSSVLQALVNQALEQGDGRKAKTLCQALLLLNPKEGGALHSMGVALLACGMWGAAHETWARAALEAPSNAVLAAQVAKDNAYREVTSASASNETVGNSLALPTFVTTVASEHSDPPEVQHSRLPEGLASLPARARQHAIHLTSTPVFSPDECRRVIEEAEEHAKTGWTTSRHYGVPTTDLPVHILPGTLAWLNRAMRRTLFPLLHEQFGCKPECLRVHDAFVVKYSSDAQRALPIHRDQCHYSFTIALNRLEEYQGGGTYFCSLGRVFRPEQGHVLSFRGDLLEHGGDPVTEGVRFMLAAFVFTVEDEAEGEAKAEAEAGGKSLTSLGKRSRAGGLFTASRSTHDNLSKAEPFAFNFMD